MVLGNPYEKPSDAKSLRSPKPEGAALPFDRLASHVADLVLLVPVMALAMAPFRRMILEAKLLENSFDSNWAFVQSLAAAFAVGVVWETFFIGMWGTTPGRAIFGLRVVDMWTGEKPRPFHAFLRGLTWWGSVLALGAPFFGVYGNSKRRPLHDRVADTEVRSRNTRRQSAPPKISELAFGSLFATGAVFFASLVLTSQVYVLRESARLADGKDKPSLCEDVSVAMDQWEGREAKPPRISVALSLSAAGVVDPGCLEVESDYALWADQGRLLGYLSKGILRFSQNLDADSETAELYFSKVCEIEPDSDSCRLVSWYRSLSPSGEGREPEALEALEGLARSFVPNGPRVARAGSSVPDWMRLLVLRDLFVARGDPALILQLTQEPAKHELVGAKLVEYRARAYWRLDRKTEAKATVFASVDALPRRQRVQVTSWLCSRELYEGSGETCGADTLRACDLMERAADEDSGDFATPSFLVASLRNAECRIEKGRGTSSAYTEIAKHVDEPNGKKLIEALLQLRGQDREKGLSSLRDLASVAEAEGEGDLFVTEANIRLAEEIAKRSRADKDSARELSDLRVRWFAARGSRRYEDWGRALFDAFVKREEWSKAAEVGLLLNGEVEGDRRLQSRIAIAAWKAGKQKIATEIVDSLEKSRFPASLDPAAKSSDEKTLDHIRRSGRHR